MTLYAPPTGNDVTLNFAGAYTPPAGGAMLFNFENVLAHYELTIIGSDTIVNGTFDLNTSGWTVVGADTTFASVGGIGVLTLGHLASGGYAYQGVAVVPDTTYTLEIQIIPNESARATVQFGTTPGGVQIGYVDLNDHGTLSSYFGTARPVRRRVFSRTRVKHGASVPIVAIEFEAPASLVYISLTTSADRDCTASFDEISMGGEASYKLTGTPATITKTGRAVGATPGVYALNGAAATLTVQRRITLESGSYIRTGTGINLRVGRYISPAPGSYALAGGTAELNHIVGKYIIPETGVYALSGSNVQLTVSRKLSATPGSYALTGVGTDFVYRRAIKVASGSYALSGTAARLLMGYRAKLAAGSYVLTGTAADLINRRLVVTSGTYALQGTAAALLVGKRLQAAPGVYAQTGTAATLRAGRRIAVTPGAYALSGVGAGLYVGKRLVVTPGSYSYVGTSLRVSHGYKVTVTAGSYALSGTAAHLVAARRITLGSRAFHLSWPNVTLTPTWRPRGPRAIGVGLADNRYVAVPPQNRRVAVDPPQDRRVSVEPGPRRYAAVEPRDNELEGG